MRRRSFLIGGAVTAATGAIAAAPGRAESGLAVEIEYRGRTWRFDEAAATDLGDYRDPAGRFVQGCMRSTQNDFPLSVMFRPDRRDDRQEVVFEVGDPWSAAPTNFGPYDFRIMRGSRVLHAGTVAQHYWFSRWRWQSAPRPATVSPRALIEKRLLPAFDPRAAAGAPPAARGSYAVMGLAGLTGYMPTTGERDEIGPVTEAQGEYIGTGNGGALATLLAQGEAGGTIPWNIRDSRTAAPLDVMKYPEASLYGAREGHPYIASTQTPIQIDVAHEPAVAYLPYLLTGDPYHLETLQFQANWNVLRAPPAYRYSMEQIRGNAWSMRTLGQVATVTPAAVPRWLLPQAHFRRLLDSYRDWLMRDFVDNRFIVRTVFRTTLEEFGDLPGGGSEAVATTPWQEDMQAFVFGWLVLMGHADWRPIFLWKLGSTVARTNGVSGWQRAMCSPYYFLVRAGPKGAWMQSWAEAWRLNVAAHKWRSDYPDHWAGEDPVYFSYTRGVLAIARQLGVTGAEPSLDWVEVEWNRIRNGRTFVRHKWAIAA